STSYLDHRHYHHRALHPYPTRRSPDLPGYQLLKGRDALAYVRYRHTDSDLYRLARQQQFVKALKEQVSSNFSAFTNCCCLASRRSEDTRLNPSHVASSYAVFCLKKKNE